MATTLEYDIKIQAGSLEEAEGIAKKLGGELDGTWIFASFSSLLVPLTSIWVTPPPKTALITEPGTQSRSVDAFRVVPA